MNRSTKQVVRFVFSVVVVVFGTILQASSSSSSLSFILLSSSHTVISSSSSSSSSTGSMSTSIPSSTVVDGTISSSTEQQQQSVTVTSSTEKNDSTTSSTNNKKILVVGTRIHLGQSDTNSQQLLQLNQNEYNEKICKYYNFCYNICYANNAVIAIDGSYGTELYTVIQNAIQYAKDTIVLTSSTNSSTSSTNSSTNRTTKPTIDIIIVQPWGRFVPALNSIISWSMQLVGSKCDYLVLVSIEAAAASKDAIQQLLFNMESTSTTTTSSSSSDSNNDGLVNPILVSGAVLPGHDYQHNTKNPSDTTGSTTNEDNEDTKSTIVPLNGVTSPWNTLAIWNVRKLALTGFQLVSEGLIQDYNTNHDNNDNSKNNNYYDYAGIEEVVTIATLQKFLGSSNCIVKLVQLKDNSLEWDTTTSFINDKKRQEWHIRKMQSKLSRSIHQLQLLFGANYLNDNNHNFIVHHC